MNKRNKLYRQWGLSFGLFALFIFFFFHGPLQRMSEVLNLETQSGKFSAPIFLGDKETIQSSQLVNVANISGFGHSLILNQQKTKPSTGLISQPIKKNDQKNGVQIMKHAQQLFEDAHLEFVPNGSTSYVMVDKNDQRSYYIESEEIVQNIVGYAGPINVGVLLSEKGKIESVHHVSSKETQSYLRKIDRAGYYQSFTQLGLNKEHQVDGISGATISSEAIARTASATIKEVFPDPFENYIDRVQIHSFDLEAIISNTWMIHAGVIVVLFLYGLQKRYKKTKKMMTIVRVVSLLYMGFYLNNSFTYTSILHPFMGVTLSILTAIYIFMVLIGAIWGNNIYCTYVCPFGNGQCLSKQVVPGKWQSKFVLSNKWLSRIRATLTILLIVGILFGFDEWKNFELFPDLFGGEYISFWFSLAFFFILLSIKYPMLWCRSLCPTGFILDGVSTIANKGLGLETTETNRSFAAPKINR